MKLQEVYYHRGNAAAVVVNGRDVFAAPGCTRCPMVFSYPVDPGDVVTIQEDRGVLGIYWFELSSTPTPNTTATDCPRSLSDSDAIWNCGDHDSDGNFHVSFGGSPLDHINTSFAARECGWELTGGSAFMGSCPDGWQLRGISHLALETGETSRAAGIYCDQIGNAAWCAASESMVSITAQDGAPLTYRVPAGFQGFRVKLQETYYAYDTSGAWQNQGRGGLISNHSGVSVNGVVLWSQTVCTQCPTAVTHNVSAGDIIELHSGAGGNNLAIYSLDLLTQPVANTAEADCSQYNQTAILECNTTLPNGDVRVDFGQSTRCMCTPQMV